MIEAQTYLKNSQLVDLTQTIIKVIDYAGEANTGYSLFTKNFTEDIALFQSKKNFDIVK